MIHPDVIGMRSISQVLFVIGVVSFCCVQCSADKQRQPVPSEEDCARGLSDVRQLRADLARQGVVAFVTNAATPRTAPHIHSQCWVDWLPREEVERRAYEQEKRDFGLDMIVQLEKLGARRIEMGDVVGLRTGAEKLVAIAEWAKTSPGYGNYILKHQAEELAMVLMAKMAVNEKCSIQEVRELLDRIDTPEKSACLQVSVLNEESPHADNIRKLS